VAACAMADVSAADRLTVGHFMMRRWTLAEDVAGLERLGFRSISVASSKLEAFGVRRGLRLLRSSSLRVSHVLSSAAVGVERARRRAALDRARRAIERAHELEADVVVVIAGARGTRAWQSAAADLAHGMGALLPAARAAGVRLAVEVIHPLRQDLSFVNTVADASALVRRAGPRAGYVLDTWHSGWEPRLLDVIDHDARSRIHAVQLSDYKRVTLRNMDRALLGRGVLPLEEIVGRLERAGYRGWYELEIISDDVERMGYERALTRSRAAFVRLLRASERNRSPKRPR
jgi:sugar phosphate isomerase/epimerase